MALGTNANPIYDPNASYGGTQAWRQTDFVKKYLDPQIPEGVFTAFLGERGLGGNDAMSTWAQGLYGKSLAGYKAAMRANPNLTFRDYLGKQYTGDSLRSQWLGQSARSRGEYPSQSVGNTNVIAWG